jgi:hypothetical protein
MWGKKVDWEEGWKEGRKQETSVVCLAFTRNLVGI